MPAPSLPTTGLGCPSTGISGACEVGISGQLTLFAGGSHASHGPLPGSAGARGMTAISGQRCFVLLPSVVRAGSLGRMLAVLFRIPWGSTAVWLGWRVKVTPAGRSWFRLAPWTPRTGGIESGLLPTPNVPNGGRGIGHVSDWRGKTAYHNGKKVQVGLESLVRLLPTPMARDSHLGGASTTARPFSMTLGQLAALLPTPTTRDWKSGNASQETLERNARPLSEVIGGRLNPDFVEWMMGFPAGWTDIPYRRPPSKAKS